MQGESEFDGPVPLAITPSELKPQKLSAKAKLGIGISVGAVCLVGLIVGVSVGVITRQTNAKPSLHTAVMRLTPAGLRPESCTYEVPEDFHFEMHTDGMRVHHHIDDEPLTSSSYQNCSTQFGFQNNDDFEGALDAEIRRRTGISDDLASKLERSRTLSWDDDFHWKESTHIDCQHACSHFVETKSEDTYFTAIRGQITVPSAPVSRIGQHIHYSVLLGNPHQCITSELLWSSEPGAPGSWKARQGVLHGGNFYKHGTELRNIDSGSQINIVLAVGLTEQGGKWTIYRGMQEVDDLDDDTVNRISMGKVKYNVFTYTNVSMHVSSAKNCDHVPQGKELFHVDSILGYKYHPGEQNDPLIAQPWSNSGSRTMSGYVLDEYTTHKWINSRSFGDDFIDKCKGSVTIDKTDISYGFPYKYGDPIFGTS